MRVPSQATFRATTMRAGLGRPRALAVWTTWALALGLVLIGLVEALPSGIGSVGFVAVTLQAGLPALVVLPTVTVGALLITRLPRHMVGWLLLAGGVSLALADGFGAPLTTASTCIREASPARSGSRLFPTPFTEPYRAARRIPAALLPDRPRALPALVAGAGHCGLPTFLAPVANLFVPLTPGTYPTGVQNPLVIGGRAGNSSG